MSTALDHVRPVAVPGRVGQGTAVEQSRAIAEVQAQVIVAQQMPRDITRANREMLRSCAMKGLADKAFYRYKRAGAQITGPSVQLARELARAWGNVQYGITELRRDDEHGQSEMLAFAWDLETNTRSTTTFIVQHVRDTSNGSKALTDQRDIYENNANNGARRLREMIFAILPGWYTEDAVAACYATLAGDDSDGATVADRAATAATRFGTIGVTLGQLENKLGAPQGRWSPSDLAQLAVIWRSIDRGETSADAEFGPSPARVTAADILGEEKKQPEKAAGGGRQRRRPQEQAPPPEEAPWPTDAQAEPEAAAEHRWRDGDPRNGVIAQLSRLGVTSTQGQVDWAVKVTGVALTSLEGLNHKQASDMTALLARCATTDDIEALLATGEVPDEV